MKVEVTREFYDLREGVSRKAGDQFVCSKDRFAQINSAGYGVMVTPVPEGKAHGDEVPEDETPEE